MNVEAGRYYGYRWVVLGAACLVVMSVSLAWWMVPSLAFRLFPELSLTHLQYTLIFTAPFILAIVGSMIGGALGDRYGIRLIVAIGVFTAGIVGLARGFVPDFAGMFTMMFLYGLHLALVVPNLPKLVSIWFPSRQAGLGAGIYFASMGIGASLGLLTGPLFDSLRSAFVYTGIFVLVVAVLWTLLARNSPKGVEIRMPPVLSGIKRGLRSRNVWLLAISMFLANGIIPSFLGNFADALEGVHQISPERAGAVASFVAWGTVAGHALIPALSDRVGRRKPFIGGGAVCAAACFFFGWQLAPSVATWVLVFLGGFIWAGLAPTLYACLIELPEIGSEHVGGASGFVATLGQVGGFCMPVLVISSIVAAGTMSAYTTGFLVAAILLAAVILPIAFVIESGARAKSSGM